MKKLSDRRKYLLYDERALSIPVDDCQILDTANSEAEARDISRFARGIWYEYELCGGDLVNGIARPDLSERAK
jgi:hypothetical protein